MVVLSPLCEYSLDLPLLNRTDHPLFDDGGHRSSFPVAQIGKGVPEGAGDPSVEPHLFPVCEGALHGVGIRGLFGVESVGEGVVLRHGTEGWSEKDRLWGERALLRPGGYTSSRTAQTSVVGVEDRRVSSIPVGHRRKVDGNSRPSLLGFTATIVFGAGA